MLKNSVASEILYINPLTKVKLLALVQWAIYFNVMWPSAMLCIYRGLLFIALCIKWLLLLWTLFLNDVFVISCDPNIKENYYSRAVSLPPNLNLCYKCILSAPFCAVWTIFCVCVKFIVMRHYFTSKIVHQPCLELTVNLCNLAQVHGCEHELTKSYVILFWQDDILTNGTSCWCIVNSEKYGCDREVDPCFFISI
jgi:hypothetical protein